MKQLLLGFVIATVGFSGGYLFNQLGEEPVTESICDTSSQEKLDDLKTKFSRLSQNQISSYIKESNPMLKGEKADLVLTELLKLFLLDIGLKLANLNSDFNKSKLDYSSYKNNPNFTAEKKILLPMNCQYSRDVCEQKYGAFKINKPKLNWRHKELDLKQVAAISTVNKFLEKVQVKDLAPFVTKSKTINRAYVKLFEGEFAGQLSMSAPKSHVLDIEMSVTNVKYENGTPMADLEINLFNKDGQKTSGNGGNGVLKAITDFADRSQGFILHLSPDKKIQIYSMSGNETLFGNVYEKSANSSEFAHVGRAILKRN